MRMSRVPIPDAVVVKFMLLLALIFFGMFVRCAADWGPSKEMFQIMQLNLTIEYLYV